MYGGILVSKETSFWNGHHTVFEKQGNTDDTFQTGVNKHIKMHTIGHPTNKYKHNQLHKRSILFE